MKSKWTKKQQLVFMCMDICIYYPWYGHFIFIRLNYSLHSYYWVWGSWNDLMFSIHCHPHYSYIWLGCFYKEDLVELQTSCHSRNGHINEVRNDSSFYFYTKTGISIGLSFGVIRLSFGFFVFGIFISITKCRMKNWCKNWRNPWDKPSQLNHI